jgi:hypothetical protein
MFLQRRRLTQEYMPPLASSGRRLFGCGNCRDDERNSLVYDKTVEQLGWRFPNVAEPVDSSAKIAVSLSGDNSFRRLSVYQELYDTLDYGAYAVSWMCVEWNCSCRLYSN